MSYHVVQCQQGRNSPPHRRGRHTGSLDSAEHLGKRQSKLGHRVRTPAHSHTAALQGMMGTENWLKYKVFRKTMTQDISCMCLRFTACQFVVCTTYDRAPGTSSGCRPLCGYTPQHRQRRLCRDIHSPPLSHS